MLQTHTESQPPLRESSPGNWCYLIARGRPINLGGKAFQQLLQWRQLHLLLQHGPNAALHSRGREDWTACCGRRCCEDTIVSTADDMQEAAVPAGGIITPNTTFAPSHLIGVVE